MPDVGLHQWVVNDIKADQSAEETIVCQSGTGLDLTLRVVVDEISLVG